MSDFSVPNAKPGPCDKCSGSGLYRWGGGTINGVFVGKEGPCHSCGGSGHQTQRDIKRNIAYNRHKLATISL